MENFDICFPHLGLGIERLRDSITVFGFRIAFYGMIIGVGMLLGIFVAGADYKRRGYQAEVIQDLALLGIITGIIGARCYYVMFEWSYYSQHLAEIPNIRQGGLAIYGGIIAATAAMAVFCRIRRIPFFQLGDSAVLGVICGQILGRWGNFFNCEAFGGPTDTLFAMRIRESLVNSNMMNQAVYDAAVTLGGERFIQVHPTFLYESLWNAAGLILLWSLGPKKKFEGQVFWTYLAWYGAGRFWIEGLRTDSLMIWGTGIAVSQLLSGILVVAALIVIMYQLYRNRKLKTEG